MTPQLMQRFVAAPYRGSKIRYRAWVRLEPEAPGDRAMLWIRVDRPAGEVGFTDHMADRPITATEWRVYEIDGRIDDDAEYLNIGVIGQARGRIWLDDVSLEIAHSPGAAATANTRAAFRTH